MSYTSEDIWARELYKINQPNPFSGHITPTAPNDYSGRALTHGPNYNAQEAAHPFPASFTNPAGSNINCSAVALARLHSYNVGANALQEETLGYLPNGQGLDIPTRPGIDLDDMDVFMKELCSTSTTQRFFPQGGKSAGEIMCACYVPPPGPSTFAASVVACTRRDGIGHAVNMYHRRSTPPANPSSSTTSIPTLACPRTTLS